MGTHARRINGAAHAETDPDADELVVVPLECSFVRGERQGVPVLGTKFAAICGDAPFIRFHWCGYGLNPRIEAQLQGAGVVLAARAADAGVQAIELADHPFFLATAFQPQVGASTSDVLHPVITAVIDAAADRPRSSGAAVSR